MDPLCGLAADWEDSNSLGRRLRRYREEKGISLQALSRVTGLSPSFLSRVERDLTIPSIGSLRRITDSLSVPLFLLFTDTGGRRSVVHRDARWMLKLPTRGVTCELLVPFANQRMEAFMVTLAPGSQTSDTGVFHAGEEWVMVLKGHMSVQVADDVYTLEEGDCIYYSGWLPHRIRNGGEEDLIVICVVVHGEDHKLPGCQSGWRPCRGAVRVPASAGVPPAGPVNQHQACSWVRMVAGGHSGSSFSCFP